MEYKDGNTGSVESCETMEIIAEGIAVIDDVAYKLSVDAWVKAAVGSEFAGHDEQYQCVQNGDGTAWKTIEMIELAVCTPDGDYDDAGSFRTLDDAKEHLTQAEDGDYVASRGDERWAWGFRVTEGEVECLSPEMM